MPADSRYGMNCAIRNRHPAPSSGMGESASTRIGRFTATGSSTNGRRRRQMESSQAA